MSIYIKGMKLPKEGRYAVIRVIPDGTVFAECLGIGDGTEELPKLKAVEVKEPHGRLIDADKLKKTEHDIHIESIGYHHRCISMENVNEAPTVIEAEVE